MIVNYQVDDVPLAGIVNIPPPRQIPKAILSPCLSSSIPRIIEWNSGGWGVTPPRGWTLLCLLFSPFPFMFVIVVVVANDVVVDVPVVVFSYYCNYMLYW